MTGPSRDAFARSTARAFASTVLPAVVLMAAVVSTALPVAAAPFVPSNPDEVVERLPSRRVSAAERQNERLQRERLAAAPTQLPIALQAARDAVIRSRRTGDPRELGQAQAALAPWWSLPEPPHAVRLLRATVLQSQHQFDAALRDFEALGTLPNVPVEVRAQAVLSRMAVLQVTGRWADASAACTALAGPEFSRLGAAVGTPAQVCRAELDSLRGPTPDAAKTAAAALAALSRDTTDASTRQWVALVRAELAERLGDVSAAARYREALGDTPDIYTLAAYADWLLAHDRPRDAAVLLDGREDADALLLRLAIAWQRSGDPRAAGAARTLGERFAAAAQRQDTTHRREQARFELDVRGDATSALPHAQANWAAQKEPADTLLLVRAATAAKQPAAAEPVWRFVRDSGFNDRRLDVARTGAAR